MNRHLYRAVAFFIAIYSAQVCMMSPAIADNSGPASKYSLRYMTGGVGHDEVLAMRPHAKEYTLNLLFSEGASGQAVTDVNVNIYDQQDKLVFRIKGAKPLLYVNLPAGRYTILANNNGVKLRHKLSIDGNNNQKVILNWRDEELDARETAE